MNQLPTIPECPESASPAIHWRPGMSYIHPDYAPPVSVLDEASSDDDANKSKKKQLAEKKNIIIKNNSAAEAEKKRPTPPPPRASRTVSPAEQRDWGHRHRQQHQNKKLSSSLQDLSRHKALLEDEDLEGDELLMTIDPNFKPVDHAREKQAILMSLPTPARRAGSLDPLPVVGGSLPASPSTSVNSFPAVLRRLPLPANDVSSLPGSDRTNGDEPLMKFLNTLC